MESQGSMAQGMRLVLQLLATVYAVAVLVITIDAYTRSLQHPRLSLLFVASTASFYIIFYNALYMAGAFSQWITKHRPSIPHVSLAAALVLAAIPISVLYVTQSAKPAQPGTPQAATPAARPPVPSRMLSAPSAAEVKPATSQNASPRAVLKDIRYQSGPAFTTVEIYLSEQVQYEINRLTGPDRIYIDLKESTLDPAMSGRKFQVQDSLLEKIRVAEHESHFTRITLQTKGTPDYSVTPLPSSHRLRIELKNRADSGA